MSVDPATASMARARRADYYFCCAGCRTKFAADPAALSAPSQRCTRVVTPRRRRGARDGAAKDPVCGMSVDPATAAHRFEHDGTTSYFCCAGCRTKFAADPARYLGPAPAERATRPGRDDLHLPDASRNPAGGPGLCPICGMALEPETPSAEAGPNAELDRHEAPALVRARAGGPAGRPRHGRASLPAGTG